MRIFARDIRAWILATYLTAALLPFLTQTGRNLEYNYATLVTLGAWSLIPILAAVAPKLRGWPQSSLVWLGVLPWIVMIVPGAALLVSDVCLCGDQGFYLWMLLQVVPALPFQALLVRSRLEGPLKGWTVLRTLALGWGGLALLVLGVGTTLALLPQKRHVLSTLGVLHGPIYDTDIRIDGNMILSRLALTILGLACHFGFGAWLRRRWRDLGLLHCGIALGAWAALSFMVGSGHGGTAGHGLSRLTHALPEQRVVPGGGATIHFHRDSVPAERLQLLVAEVAFHLGDLRGRLGLEGPVEAATGEGPRPIQVFVYGSRDQKKTLFGGGATDITDVVTPSVHIVAGVFPHGTLRHELVHALASTFGYRGLGFHPNMAITEGLAVALAPEESELTLREGARALLRRGRLPNPRNLFSWRFFEESADRAYTTAGAFLEHLLQTRGPAAVRALYSGRGLEYTDLISIFEAWEKSLASEEAANPLPGDLLGEAIFRSSGVWRDICPMSKADLSRGTPVTVWDRVRQPWGWDVGRDFDPWRRRLQPTDRALILGQIRERARQAATRRPMDLAALEVLSMELSEFVRPSPEDIEDLWGLLLASDLARARGAVSESLATLERLGGLAFRGGERLQREVEARRRIEEDLGGGAAAPGTSSRARVWRLYLAGWQVLPQGGDRDRDMAWVAQYLTLRRQAQQPGLQLATRLEDLLVRYDLTSLEARAGRPLVVAWLRTLGDAAMVRGNCAVAESAYGEAVRWARGQSQEVLRSLRAIAAGKAGCGG